MPLNPKASAWTPAEPALAPRAPVAAGDNPAAMAPVLIKHVPKVQSALSRGLRAAAAATPGASLQHLQASMG